ncbi:MAG TPA: zinc ribbon domain-containing protein [Gaiella sp.]|jgi:putative FmdB family regulatory protein|nr:zinc ribbon domain-containing protein [Gaiella sp.]
MPIYEYRCPNGHTFEVFQRMSDPPVSVCEICGAGPVEKLLFPVAVHFKGSGFYSTDYGRGSRKGAGKDAEGSTSSSDGSAKTEQPAPKTDTKSSDSKPADG